MNDKDATAIKKRWLANIKRPNPRKFRADEIQRFYADRCMGDELAATERGIAALDAANQKVVADKDAALRRLVKAGRAFLRYAGYGAPVKDEPRTAEFRSALRAAARYFPKRAARK